MSSSERLRQILSEHENSRKNGNITTTMSSFTYSRPLSPTYHDSSVTTLQIPVEHKMPRAHLTEKSGKHSEALHYGKSKIFNVPSKSFENVNILWQMCKVLMLNCMNEISASFRITFLDIPKLL